LADALDELPLTGGNMLLFLGIGSCLGGVGALIRKIGK
jgi:LPXTG-motif cell wall-anchored protein